MKRFSCLIFWGCLAFFQSQTGRAQETAPIPTTANSPPPPARSDHAPRAYAITLGGAYTFLSKLPLTESGKTVHPAGVQIGGRFGWQVRGLLGGAPSTIGIESNLLFQPAAHARDSYGFIYGVFAKHSFTQLRVRPYFSYGLGAAQVWVAKVHGRGIGHSTRLAIGADTPITDGLRFSFDLAYQGILMPRFALDGAPAHDTSFHTVVLALGLWFGA